MKLTDKEITDALRAGKRVKRQDANHSTAIRLNSSHCVRGYRFAYPEISDDDLEATDWEVIEQN